MMSPVTSAFLFIQKNIPQQHEHQKEYGEVVHECLYWMRALHEELGIQSVCQIEYQKASWEKPRTVLDRFASYPIHIVWSERRDIRISRK